MLTSFTKHFEINRWVMLQKRLVFSFTSENKSLGFQSLKGSTEKGINHPGFKTWNPACLAVTDMWWSPSVGWNELRWVHYIMQFPFLSLQQQGEDRGSTKAQTAFILLFFEWHTTSAMIALLSAKDSLYLKCNQNALSDKRWQAI